MADAVGIVDGTISVTGSGRFVGVNGGARADTVDYTGDESLSFKGGVRLL